ncbi:MAG: N-acetylmuramoyl-L-alanine amidase [Clostridiales bacterium]|nr:N-acetylmuramoyl-L-alanine amidase [Clostridiales bacterium]
MRVIFIKRRTLFILWLIVGILIAGTYILKIRKIRSIQTFNLPLGSKTIVIDAGHGGIDPGAVSPSGTREDKINLKIAYKLKETLAREGSTVIMTRTSDEGLYDTRLGKGVGNLKRQDMQRRVEIIKNSNPDIVVSIHLNYFNQSQYYGAQVFYMDGSGEGKNLAQCIQLKLIDILNRGNNRQIKSVDNILILKASSAPSVLVECGFLSNPDEEKLLKTDRYLDDVAYAIYCGIVDYFSEP